MLILCVGSLIMFLNTCQDHTELVDITQVFEHCQRKFLLWRALKYTKQYCQLDEVTLSCCLSNFLLSVVDQTRCNVWILDGDPYHKGLLKFSLDAISLKDTLVMLVVDMSKPWTALDSLQKWASVVREHIDKLKIPPEEMKEMEQKCE